MNNDGGPAFPRKLPDVHCSPDEALRIIEKHAGMSLRDYFAAKALCGVMQVIVSGIHQRSNHDAVGPDVIAQSAYKIADAMLIARKA